MKDRLKGPFYGETEGRLQSETSEPRQNEIIATSRHATRGFITKIAEKRQAGATRRQPPTPSPECL